jgi:hypothetical protein
VASADLAITLSVRMGNLEAGLNKANSALRAMERQSKETGRAVAGIGQSFRAMEAPATAAFGAIRASIAGVIALVAGGGLVAGISAALSRVNALADAAAQVGVEVEALQTIQIGFEEAGSSAQTAAMGLGRLGALIGDAVRGGKEAQETFVRLGVSFRNVDGSARTTVQAFNDLRARIAGASSEQEKLSIAAEVFGARGARAAVAAMAEMGDSVEALTARYSAMGLVVSGETATALDNIGTSFANLGRAISVVLADSLAAVAPTIQAVVDGARRAFTSIGPQIVQGFTEVTASIVAFVQKAVEEFRPLWDAFAGVVRELAPVVAAIVRLVGQSFYKVAQDLQPIAVWIINTLRTIIGWVTEALKALGIMERSALEVAERGFSAASEAATRATNSLMQAEERLANARRVNGSLVAIRSAEAEVARLREQAARATAAQATAQEELNRVRASQPGQGTVPTAPTVAAPPQPAGAPPRVTAGGAQRETEAQREANRLLRESYRDLMKIQEASLDPQTRMVASLGEVTTALREQDRAFQAYMAAYGRAPANIEPVRLSLEALTMHAETAAERMMRSAEALGQPAEQIMEQISAAVRAYAEELARAGRITTDQIDRMVAAAQNAANRVQSTGFMAGFRSGAGVDLTKPAPDFMTEIGRGFGQISTQVFDDLASSLDKVASGAMTAGEAMSRFALDFVKAVAMMIAKAAALAAIQFLIRSIFGTPSMGGAANGSGAASFGGFRAAGGPVSGGRAYIVGERGPELFVPSGSGRIVPNGAGGPTVQIVNNAPGVVVEQARRDDQIVAIAVNLSRQRVATDFAESTRTGYGTFAESMSSRYALRRRV